MACASSSTFLIIAIACSKIRRPFLYWLRETRQAPAFRQQEIFTLLSSSFLAFSAASSKYFKAFCRSPFCTSSFPKRVSVFNEGCFSKSAPFPSPGPEPINFAKLCKLGDIYHHQFVCLFAVLVIFQCLVSMVTSCELNRHVLTGRPQGMSKKQNPSDFLKLIIGKPVVVKLNSGVDYRGVLACLDGYMNIALEQTEEYVNGQLKNKYGDAFIRGNNVLYISTTRRV